MAKFLQGHELNSELERLLENAQQQIVLISPYIKLHERYASVLREKKKNPDIKIKIVFGKNEDNMAKSMKQDDFNFFKEFPNIQISYDRRLHAKYYASESTAILTSMNLYSYSQDNNIEAGVLTKFSLLGNLANKTMTGEDNLDNQAWKYFDRVWEQSDLLYRKIPQYESTMLGLSKRYKESKIEVDKLTDFFAGNWDSKRHDGKYDLRIMKEIEYLERLEELEQNEIMPVTMGFCIRTGIEIPFNPERPFSDKAFKSWAQFKNEDYPEKYCHFSGELSDGETSKSKPILRKNWKKAKDEFGF